MEHCIVFTVRDGQAQAARDFMRELADTRRVEQQRSQRRVGIGGERWFLANSRQGELLVGLIESGDLGRTVGLTIAVTYALFLAALLWRPTGLFGRPAR